MRDLIYESSITVYEATISAFGKINDI